MSFSGLIRSVAEDLHKRDICDARLLRVNWKHSVAIFRPRIWLGHNRLTGYVDGFVSRSPAVCSSQDETVAQIDPRVCAHVPTGTPHRAQIVGPSSD